jgi:two-component system sensor histidine kinase KdpD
VTAASSFEAQRLDSSRHAEAPRPMRDTSTQPSVDEILAATAHELRLPLSHIKGFVSSLRRSDIEWDDETRSDFLAEIDLETDRLAQLVEELCTMRNAAERGLAARGPDGSYGPGTHLAFTTPAALVGGALHRIRGLFGERRVRIDVPSTLPSVPMDAAQMERVLANLLQNAIKYSPDGSAIGISARITDDGELDLCVEDEGPGIRPEDRERIFEPFVRTRTARQSAVTGHGLGLAICQSIVLAHGGRMQVSDRPGGGARFHVFLPARPQRKRIQPRVGSGWYTGVDPDRGVPIRPTAA